MRSNNDLIEKFLGKEYFNRMDVVCAECQIRNLAFCGSPVVQSLTQRLRMNIRGVRAKQIITRGMAGSECERCLVVAQGWACRYGLTATGERQILSFLLPGDFIGETGLFLEAGHFSVQAITDMRLCEFPTAALQEQIRKNAALAQCMQITLASGLQRYEERLISLGRRSATERVCGLILEIHARLKVRGMVKGNVMFFPISQRHIADAAGLTQVHVSRIVKQLRDERLIALDRRSLTILNERALVAVSALSPADLAHLTAGERRFAAMSASPSS